EGVAISGAPFFAYFLWQDKESESAPPGDETQDAPPAPNQTKPNQTKPNHHQPNTNAPTKFAHTPTTTLMPHTSTHEPQAF
ncbi:hypothetical protein, partial [Ralstonia pseudosolanacearum]|uniref:hypothetical protein n=1 Tax=Ralstonia pseudosolanacearum TaxID=1310165 RepID=UPI003397FD5E